MGYRFIINDNLLKENSWFVKVHEDKNVVKEIEVFSKQSVEENIPIRKTVKELGMEKDYAADTFAERLLITDENDNNNTIQSATDYTSVMDNDEFTSIVERFYSQDETIHEMTKELLLTLKAKI